MNVRCFIKCLAPLGFGLFAAALWAGDIAISDGQNAENVVGQLDSTYAPMYTKGGTDNGPNERVFSTPYGVDVDTTSHRLFVADKANNRVLEFDLDSSNALVDLSADHVLGQSGFHFAVTATAANSMSSPRGVVYVPKSGKLFVGDTSNSRVLVFDVAAITDGENAVNVLGQADFTSSGVGTTINGMWLPQGLDFDSSTDRLFVGDSTNRRVLVFDVASITNGENAINVLGQTTFTTRTSNRTQGGLTTPTDVAYSPAGNRLFVADLSRVMVFDVAAITDGENAVNVLGQANFTSASSSISISTIGAPVGLSFDGGANRLYVSEDTKNRIVVFDVAAITNGENAVNVLGQSNFTSSSATTTVNGLSAPYFIHISSGGNNLFVPDSGNHRLLVFDMASITDGENAVTVAGQTNDAGSPIFTKGGRYDGPNRYGYNQSPDVAIDTTSHRLFVADNGNNRVLEYDLNTSNTLVDWSADHVLGQPDFMTKASGVTQNQFSSVTGLEYDPSGNRLFVVDSKRILIFDVASITDGENAVNVLGQTDYTSTATGTTQGRFQSEGITYSSSMKKLFVSDSGSYRVLVFDLTTVTDGEDAVNVLGQPDFTSSTYGCTQSLIGTPADVAIDSSGNRLFVANPSSSRALVFDVASITDGENAVNVLGQADFTSSAGGAAANTFMYPKGVEFDALSNRLFVADTNGNRLLIFDIASITDGENAVNVLGQSSFTGSASGTAADKLSGPQHMSFDNTINRLYISEFSNSRVVAHSMGVMPPAVSVLSASAGTITGTVNLSWPSAGDDGAFNALTGYYRIQYATYTATWSTSTTPTNAVTSTITATGVTPGVVQSTTIAGLTSGATYYFALFTADDVPNWSGVSNTASAVGQSSVTVTEMGSQPGWIGRGETQRILGTAQVVADTTLGVTISSVAVRETGAYTADGNLTNVEVWVSSSGYIDANAVRLENTAKAFTSDAAVFAQNVTVSTTPLYFIARCDVGGSATEGTFDVTLQVYTTGVTVNNPVAFTNATDVVAPPSGAPSGLSATASGSLLRVSLSWAAGTGVDSYSIYRATYSGVTTTDYFLGVTAGTSFNDDSIPPAQQMYYTVVGTNRAGASSASSAANATSVDVAALTTSNIYLRAGIPGGYVSGNYAYGEAFGQPHATTVDSAGNLYIADGTHRIRFVPRASGTYFGQAMVANNVYTLAGTGTLGYTGENVAATTAPLWNPYGVSVDMSGNVYIADRSNCRIRFVPKTGGTYFGQAMTANYIYSIAGTGTGGYVADNVAATGAQINNPGAVSVDSVGNVYIADYSNHRIRFIAKTTGTYFGQSMTANYIYTIAGTGSGGYVADSVAATSTQIYNPSGVSVDAAGNVYIADYNNNRIRFIAKTSGTYFGQSMTANSIYTIAGNGSGGYTSDSVAATGSMLNQPREVSVDASGNVIISDYSNSRVRFVPKTSGTNFGQAMTANYIYTLVNSTYLYYQQGASADPQGNIYIANTIYNTILFLPKASGTYFGQTMTANSVYTIAGNGSGGYSGVGRVATTARLDSGSGNSGLTVDSSGNIYIADYNNTRIFFIPKTSGTYFGQSMTANYIYTIAGTGWAGYSSDNVAATSTGLNQPRGVCLDSAGNVYIADTGNNRIRFIPRTSATFFGQSMTANYIYTIAGNGTGGYLADNVAATSTQIYLPSGVAVDGEGNVVLSQIYDYRVRFVPKTTGTYFGQSMTANYIYTIAGNGTAGYLADNVAATSTRINTSYGISVDVEGNIFIPDTLNHRIRYVPRTTGTYFGQSMTANCIYTLAGNGISGYVADNVAATNTQIYNPYGVNVDAGGNFSIADLTNNRIRFVPKRTGTYFGQSMTATRIYTIGGPGTGTDYYSGENAAATGKIVWRPANVFSAADNMVYVMDGGNKVRMIAGEDFIAPSTSTISGTVGTGEVTLNWTSAGDNADVGNLTGNYRIQYATYTASWSTTSTPTNATTVTVSTTNAVAGSAQSQLITGLGGTNVYFVLWSQDEAGNWSDISNTLWTPLESIAPSTSTLSTDAVTNLGAVILSWTSAGDDDTTGNLTGLYRVQYATYTATWSTSTTPTNATTLTVTATNVTPGSAKQTSIPGLTPGTTQYFVLWTQDDANNWSGISNTTSAVVGTDTVAPDSSSLMAVAGTSAGAINLSWASAGDNGSSGSLTGYYRIQYATYTATWSTSTTPTGAYTSTVTATGVTPGVVQSTIAVVSVTTIQPWYFVIWTQDDSGNWSTVSSAVSASPAYASPVFGVATSVGGGLAQGGTAWGDYDKDGDLDIVVSGTDGTNNQIRVFKSNGDGTFNSTAVNVAAANGGLKEGDVAFGDFDNDGDLDVLASGTDGTNRQLRVYKNNGDATFNTTAVEVPGSSNIGLSSGTVAWGDYDNDGDLDVLVSGTDGSNNQLRVYKNKGDSTFDATAIDVAGLNSGLKQGSVAWGDYDKDGDLDILASGTDGTNRQLRVYKNNGDGTFNSTAVNVAGSANIGLGDGRAVWGDFNKDGYLDVVVSGTDGTNYQLRTYANNGDGTFNSTPVNLAGSNLGVSYSAVAVGDYNVDGNPDVLAAGRVMGLVGHWKLDENTGTSAADLSGNGITGTLTNGPTWTTGKYGYAVNFDGADDHVTMGDPNSLDIVGQLTISAWIYPRTTGGGGLGRIFDKNSSVTGTAGYVLYLQNITVTNGLTFGIGDLSGSPARSVISSANAVTLNQWQHVVVTYDGSKLVKIYVNNVVVGSNTFAEFPTANTNNAVIGGRTTSNTRNFDGYIDDVRIYNRALSAAEVLALYQATKSSVGTLRIHKGVGDGTFNATPVEVDAGLEKGNVAWGDADGDGDLDIVTAGSDGSASQLGVYLSTQSLTASNTAPSVPGGLSASFSLNASSVSVASFTWTAGSDSGTGTTTENALGYDIRISTKSDFSLLVAPGEEGASPRLGSYLRPPKIFSGSTTYGVMLKSTDPWNAQGTASYGLRTDTTYYYQVKTVDAGLATSAWSDSGTLNTAVSPSTSTITASSTAVTGEILVSWSSSGDDGMLGNLTGNYRIQYATYTAVWSTSSTPTDATTVTIATTSMVPGSAQATTLTSLTGGTTYYFVLWNQDEANNWSSISNTSSAVPAGSLSTVTLAEAVGQPGWIGQGETQRILGTAQVVSDSSTGVTISSVSLQSSGYTADGNLTNVEVWLSSSGYIDANAIRLENTAKAFSSNAVAFTQSVTISTTPYYLVARADVAGGAAEGAFELTLQVHTTAVTVNNPVAFSNATDVVAPPSGAPSGLSATASGNLLQVNLSWAAGTGVDSYSIYRATYSGVTTTDFLLGVTNGTSFNDDSIPPAQQMYYTVVGTNRAGASSASSAANATSVDVSALTTSNIYLRAGAPSGFVTGRSANGESFYIPYDTCVDAAGNLYISDGTHRIRFVPRASGTYFGQAMVANNVYTIAGTGTLGYTGENLAATSSRLWNPAGVTVDSLGNVFFADESNSRIRFIPRSGGTYFGQAMTANYIYTIAGNGTSSYAADNVAATATSINGPKGVSVDGDGNVYIADTINHRVRFVARASGTNFGQAMTANYIYTIAGTGTGGYVADNVAASGAQVNSPRGVTVDAAGNVYIADRTNNRIRFIAKRSGTFFGQAMTAEYIYTIAGNGTGGYTSDNVAATGSRLNQPSEAIVDASGNVHIVDTSNYRARFIPKTTGTYFGQAMTANYIYSLANSTYLYYIRGASVDPQGNVYIANTDLHTVVMIPKASGTYFGQAMTANTVSVIAGNGSAGYSGVGRLATTARLDNGGQSSGLTVDSAGNVYIADYNNTLIFFIPKTGGTYFGQSMTANFIYTIAGNRSAGYIADNVSATSTRINNPRGVCVDSAGNVYIADTNNNRIRFIPVANGTYFGQSMTANYIYTIAGNGTGGYVADNVAATNTQIYQPSGVAVDGEGNVIFSEIYNYRVRFVPKTTGTYFGQSMTANYIYTIAGNGTSGYLADNVAATNTRISSPWGIGVDTVGNVFIPDTGNARIRFVPRTTGTYFGQGMTGSYIYTIAGNGTSGYLADNVAATSTRIYNPCGVHVDAGGNFSIADANNHRIRFVPKRTGTYFGQSMTANSIYTIGGNGSTNYSGENAAATGKYVWLPTSVYSSPDHMTYLMDYNNKVRMIAGEDFIQPSTSTLAVTAGVEQATLSWNSAGDDTVNLGNLTGTYRIQYATFTAAWSTASTPTDATTVTIATTNVVPGSAQSYVVTGLTAGPTYYFVLWSGDEVPNWSDISNTTSTIALAPIRSVTITAGNVLALGSVMMGDQVVGGTGTVVMNDGTLLNTYVLRASTLTVGTPWQVMASTPAGPDQLVFYGVFDGASAPDLGNFDVDDVVGPDDRVSTSAQFSVAGSTTGASVPAGESRTLWIRLDAPTTTTTMAGQTMRVEITAQPP